MLIFAQFQITCCLKIKISSVLNLGSWAAGNIAFYREKLEKKIVANESKYRNVSPYNYCSISSLLHGHNFLHLDHRYPVEWETISSSNVKNPNIRPIGVQIPHPVQEHHCYPTRGDLSLFFKLLLRSCSNIFQSWSGSGNFQIWESDPVQNPATIDPTKMYPWFILRNDHTDSCYCRNWKVTPDLGPVFHKIFTPDPVRKKNAESCRKRLRHCGSMATSAPHLRQDAVGLLHAWKFTPNPTCDFVES